LDLYQLARIFKKFNNNSKFPSEPKNIISYSGDVHSEFLRSALNTLGFELINEEKSNLLRCLDVSNFDPFFLKSIESIEKKQIQKIKNIYIINDNNISFISIIPNKKDLKLIITNEPSSDIITEFINQKGKIGKETSEKQVWYFPISKKNIIIDYLENYNFQL